jgi:hypothetical protein
MKVFEVILYYEANTNSNFGLFFCVSNETFYWLRALDELRNKFFNPSAVCRLPPESTFVSITSIQTT